MKKILIALFVLFITVGIFAGNGDLERNFVKSSIPVIYEHIKARAIDQWEDDHSMILYTITQQCTSFMHILTTLNDESVLVIIDAIATWSYDSDTLTKNMDNIKLFVNEESQTFSVDWLLVMDVDWAMIEYTIDTQLEAKGKY
ncbi:MAG: hypothetical protein DRP09_16395 [Candidatus Thorarchaeota archaeon]|nr:MAG: hypothetical protein DRP09_16395 [Candidatus Thorarchaeota archaeon]